MYLKLKSLPLLSMYALLAYMPFHLFLSRWLSLYTGGLGQWDAGKDIFTCIVVSVCGFLFFKEKLYKHKYTRLLFTLLAAYFLLHLSFLVFDWSGHAHRPFVVATLFNGRIFAWLFIGLIAGLLSSDFQRKTLLKILLITSTITCVFALVQYILPKDLMEHFGYSIERGAKPSFFIDDKIDFPRVMSTVRDPNSYGSYLIMPLSILWFLLLKNRLPRVKAAALLLLHALALFLTFSRGAWLGAFIALAIVAGMLYKSQLISFVRRYSPFLMVAVLLMAGMIFIFRDTYVFKNVILHSDESTIEADPNELRVHLQQLAIEGIVEDPQGHGPGTAGLVSISNPKGTFLTENYYLQIAYEVGIFGLLILLSIFIATLHQLLSIKEISAKAVLVGCFVAYSFIAILIHLWSNESVAAQYMLVTGLLIGRANGNSHNKKVAGN